MAFTRVYILAKELGVKSASIVKKCQDEGLDIKNHMSVIKAGLAATIREWFSEDENVTTVEIADKVDLKKVRIKKKKKKLAAEEAVTVAEPESIETLVEMPVAAEEGVSEALEEVEVDSGAVIEAEETPMAEPKAKKLKELKKVAKAKKAKLVVRKPPKKPEPIVPAGPMMEKPEPARLIGPQVVRVEAPEPVRRPRPKAKRYDAPVTEPLMYKELDEEDSGFLATGEKKPGVKRTGERTHGRRKVDRGDAEPDKKSRGPKYRQLDIEERRARLDAAGGEGLRLRPMRKIATKTDRDAMVHARPKKAAISEPITVKELSSVLAVKASDIVQRLMQQGVMATANQTISNDVAELVALEFGTELAIEEQTSIEEQIRTEFEEREKKNLKRRAVVAAMLGHVDHGKTSLLDKIRATKVAAGEAGGITQHIGASQITWDGKMVTFLDTPGHEAFTAMRARGANMTDVVVLVVASDDGVMPQTAEAIAHSKAAGVPIIIALNKIDLPGVDINRIYAQLVEQDLTPIEWGGKTDVVKTSAITGDGVDNLLEHLDMMGELLELQADDTIPASGWVVEAGMSPKRGPVATLLVKEGQIKKGDVVLAGGSYGRIKQLRDSFGKSIKKAASSTPVEITGLGGVPQAGDRFYCLEDIYRAKSAAEENQRRLRESSLAERTQVTLDNLFSRIEAGKIEELNIIIRADVQGSVDVLIKYLTDLSTEEVRIRILHAAPGGITEGDVVLAEASNAIIIGFNVVPEDQAAKMAEAKGVEIRLYSIIYRITEDLEKSMVGLLEPDEQEKTLGRATVRATFKVSRIGTIAGCYVGTGIAAKRAKARLIRDNIVIKDNLTLDSLKHFKDDVREVKAGLECGIKIAGYDDIKIDDVFEFYEIIKVARTLSS